MTFLALNTSTCYLIREKSGLEYNEMVAVNNYDMILDKMTSYLSENTPQNPRLATDPAYVSLQTQQQAYDSDKSQIESKLKVINAEIEGYQKAVETNIKSECKLSISV